MAAPNQTLPLPDDARQKLAKIAGRLGSEADGERAAAAKLGARLLEGYGLRWEDVLAAPSLPLPRNLRWIEPISHREGMERCALCLELFDEWETGFILKMRWEPASAWTPKRVSVANRLVARARAHAQAGPA